MIEDLDFDHTKRLYERKAELALKALSSLIPEEGIQVEIEGEEFLIKEVGEPEIMQRPQGQEDHLHGKWYTMIDATFENSHIEMVIYQSGWGGSPLPKIKVVEN